MARPAKLRQHKGYWYTQAGNPAGVYFGRIDQIPYHDAQVKFRKYLATLTKPQEVISFSPRSIATVAEV
ncbi:MAG: hypothetical protein MI725_09120 [Pirellulales bacterium]|nr:hypothetical protein [Pirellulales bacterium]